MNHLSLFSGIGGLDLAAHWAGMTTVAFCERDAFCQKVLSKHWPNVPIWDDIHGLTRQSLSDRGIGRIDIVSGGFPCQPYSVAGKQRGNKDDRALWPQMLRIIKECKPGWVVGENVAGIINLALDDVLTSLEAEGYEARAVVFPACSVGAWHIRQRVFIVAHTECNEGIERFESAKERGWAHEAKQIGLGSVANVAYSNGNGQRNGKIQHINRLNESAPDAGNDGEKVLVAYTDCKREQQSQGVEQKERGWIGDGGSAVCDTNSAGCEELNTAAFPGREGFSAWESDSSGNQWAVEPAVGRVAHGIPRRVDRLRSLGNAVVPQQAYPIFEAIMHLERSQ